MQKEIFSRALITNYYWSINQANWRIACKIKSVFSWFCAKPTANAKSFISKFNKPLFKARIKIHGRHESSVFFVKSTFIKIISENKLKLDQDLNNKKIQIQKEIDREINEVEKEIKNFKQKSLESISKISKEISSEVIKKVLNTEINESNLSAIVEEVSQKRLKNNLRWVSMQHFGWLFRLFYLSR